jgi:hypothetical protein
LGFSRIVTVNALAHLQSLEGAHMVLLFDVLQVDALNDHDGVFRLQALIDTNPTNLSEIFFFSARHR